MLKVSRRYIVWTTLGILGALGLRAPSVSARLMADDWDHYAMSAGIYPVARGELDHFDFVRRDAREHHALQAAGRMPWWMAPGLQMSLLRPLASALGQLDFSLGGYAHPGWMHMHSLAWWLVLVVGVAVLLWRLLPPPAAALGAVLYAFDDAHILPSVWIANRSELIANAFVVWALYCSVQAAQAPPAQRVRLRVSSFCLAAAALLAGEHAIPGFAYLACFELSRSERAWGARLRNLAPTLALVAAYISLRGLLGYGASGLGMYIEPLAEPARYLLAAVERLPLLFGDVVFGVAADWYPMGPAPGTVWSAMLSALLSALLSDGLLHWPAIQLTIGWLASITLAAGVVWAQRRRAELQTAVVLRWMLPAAALSIVPMCGSIAMGRLTLPAALGVDVAWALCVYEIGRSAYQGRSSRATTTRRAAQVVAAVLVAGIVCTIHLVGAGERTYRESSFYADLSHVEEKWVSLDGLDVRDRHLFLLTTGCAAQWVIPFVRHLHGDAMPRSSTPLSAATLSAHELVRTAPNVLELWLPGRPLGATFTNSVYRSSEYPFRVGDRVVTPSFEVRVLATDGGEPTGLRFAFPLSLDDAAYVFLHARAEGLAPLSLPSVGQRVTLPPGAWPLSQR